MGLNTWKTVFFPEFDSGGLSLTRDQIALRLFENAESPSTTGILAAAWTGTNVTVTRETTAPVNGEGSLRIAVAGGAGSVWRNFDRARFGYPFPGHNNIRIRYIKFRATVDSGIETIRVIFSNAAETISRYWTKDVAQSRYTEFVVDMDPDNEESYPAPVSTGVWDPEAITKFGFVNLATGRTFYFDDIEFIFEYSLVDLIGIPTEAPIDMGDVGSLHARINGLWANVKALEGQTQQYAKQGIAVAEIGQALQWALELNSDFAPPTTTEIDPGNYQIDRIRLAATQNMVASTPASEASGTIYASYTPLETGTPNWDIGDLIRVTFSGGYIRTDEEPSENPTAVIAAATPAIIAVDNAYQWQVGWLVHVSEGAVDEWATITAITSPTTFTVDTLANGYTVAATIARSIRSDLSTAVFFTMLQAEAQSFKILAQSVLTTDSTTIPADTSRTEVDDYWNGTWLMTKTGAAANQPRLIVDFANVGGVFTLDSEQPFTTLPGLVEYVIIGPNSQLAPAVNTSSNQTPAHVVGNKWELPVPVMTGTPSTTGTASIEAHTKALVARGMAAIQGTCDSGSATTAVSDDLIGYGNDYFNNHFWMTVVKNANAAGVAPEGELRLITDYVSSTGSFTTDAFSAAIEASDVIIILHESLIFAWQKLTQLQTAFFMSDYDNFDVLVVAPVDTVRWTGEEYIVGAGSTSTANINSTVAGKAYVLADPLAAATGYWLRHKPTRQGEYFSAIIDANYTWGTLGAGYLQGGLFVTKGAAYDSQNYLFIARQKSTTGATDNIIVDGRLNNGAIVSATAAVTDDIVALKIERFGNIWRFYYSTAQSPNYDWILVTQIEDASAYMTRTVSLALFAYSPGNADANTLQVDFDNFKYYTNFGYVENTLKQLVSRGASALVGTCNANMTASTTAIVVDNLVGYGDDVFNTGYQMVVLKNANSLTAAPEMEMRDITDYVSASGTFTVEAYSANAEAGDIVLVVQNHLASRISVYGIADAGSGTGLIRDAARVEANDYWNGQVVMMLSGLARGQIRPIVDFLSATDDIIVSPDFGGAVAVGDVYVILTQQFEIVPPAADDVSNYTVPQVIGRKDDTTRPLLGTTFTAMNLLKAIAARGMVLFKGAVTSEDASPTDTFYSTDLANFAEDHFNAYFYVQIVRTTDGGAPVGQIRRVSDYVASTGKFVMATVFGAAVNTGDEFVVIHESLVAIGRDDASNIFSSSSVVGAVNGSLLERVEAIQAGLQVVAAGAAGTGWQADGSDLTLYKAVAGIVESVWMDGTAQQSLADMPFVQVLGHVMVNPLVDQNAATIVANLIVHNQRPDSDAILVAEINDADITIRRYRYGTDAGFATVPVSDQDMTIVNGGATYAYTFPSAGAVWAEGDLIQYTLQDISVTIPAASGQTFTVPNIVLYGVVGGVPAANATTNIWPADVIGNKSDVASVAASQASIIGLLRGINAALSVKAAAAGGGFEIDGSPDLKDALGTTGAVVTDSATSVLGAIGADNANNAFASSTVIENGDGSVLERLEEIRGTASSGSVNITVAVGITENTIISGESSIRHGKIAIVFDVNTLIAAGEGGTLILRLKYKIDGVTLRTIDRADFLVGTDEVHPTLVGYITEGADLWSVTAQVNSAVTVNRAILWRAIQAS